MVVEYRPAAQGEQLVAPVPAANLPAEHLTHAAPPGVAAKDPAGQPAHAGAPAPATAPGRQVAHAAEEVAPTDGFAVPLEQGMQATAAVADW